MVGATSGAGIPQLRGVTIVNLESVYAVAVKECRSDLHERSTICRRLREYIGRASAGKPAHFGRGIDNVLDGPLNILVAVHQERSG